MYSNHLGEDIPQRLTSCGLCMMLGQQP